MLVRAMGLSALLILSSITSSESIRLSEPIADTSQYEIFGALPSSKKRGLSLTKIVTEAEKYEEEFVRVTTHVSKVCQRKGCFFIAVEGTIWARVVFKDYAFFLPTDSSGKQATLEGRLKRRTLSDDQAKHYSKDLGIRYSQTDHPEEYLITASSVLLMK